MARPIPPRSTTLLLAIVALAAVPRAAFAADAPESVLHAPSDVATRPRPAALLDLTSAEGARLAGAAWRYHDARLVEIDGRGPGPDLKPSGPPLRTWDYEPKAGAAAFDDRGWEAIEPSALEQRRGNGHLSFGWYRTRVTLPERVGGFDVRGATAVFEVVVDDYAEVWVDGRLATTLGDTGGGVVHGFNTGNRVVLGRDVRAGQSFQIAVFAINGPISASPSNFLWIRSATVELLPPPAPGRSHGEVVRVDAGLDQVIRPDARIEKVADGFLFTEGPVWHPDGYLLFSDPDANTLYRYDPTAGLSVYRPKSGYRGADIGEYHQPGSNGLAIDKEGRLTIDEHGNRRVTRLEKNGVLTVLADRYQGRRLNSPNDLVYRRDGALYFTDPPFGLPKVFDDPRKELPYSGVFCLRDGTLHLAASELTGPNGIAFSPDERFLYVSNWDPRRKVILRYPTRTDCSLGPAEVFFDMTGAPGEEALDGLKVDSRGNVFASGPGGVWILSPGGRHLGTLRVDELPANFAWGDADGRTLYMTARTGLYRVRVENPGAR